MFFYIPGDGFDCRPEWILPADVLQKKQLIFLTLQHHPAWCPCSHQCWVSGSRRVHWLLARLQRFHIFAGTCKVLCVVAVCTICASVFGLSIIMLSFLQFVYLLVLVFSLESTASALSYFHSTKVGKIQGGNYLSGCKRMDG